MHIPRLNVTDAQATIQSPDYQADLDRVVEYIESIQTDAAYANGDAKVTTTLRVLGIIAMSGLVMLYRLHPEMFTEEGEMQFVRDDYEAPASVAYIHESATSMAAVLAARMEVQTGINLIDTILLSRPGEYPRDIIADLVTGWNELYKRHNTTFSNRIVH